MTSEDPRISEAVEDIYLIDTGMYDARRYGGVYILDSEQPAIIETGLGTKYHRILAGLEELDIAPEEIDTIAVTHVHLDHAGGAGYLAKDCPNATVVVHERGAQHLVTPDRLVAGTKAAVGEQWTYYVDPVSIPEARIRAVTEGESIDLGDRQLAVIEAPGHAQHQVVYHDPVADAVFTGDAAGIWIPSESRVSQTTPPPEFALAQAIADVDRIEDIGAATLLFTHFGPAQATAELFSTYRTSLKNWIETVERAKAALGDDKAVIAQCVEDAAIIDEWGVEKSHAETRLNVKGALTYLKSRGEN